HQGLQGLQIMHFMYLLQITGVKELCSTTCNLSHNFKGVFSMVSFAVVAVMTVATGCHANSCTPAPKCAPAPVAACAPAPKNCGLKLGNLFHKKACAPAPACEPAPVACAPAPKKCNLKLGNIFHKKACAPAPVACETVVVAAAPVTASPQASAQK
ncbi:MAG: hypothetical protein ACKO5E_17825, partial [bacterium]